MIELSLKPIQRTTLPDVIVKQIIESLVSGGELKPGDRLLSERELAERLQVGRAAVREALRTLITLGVVRRERDGVVVCDTQGDLLAEPLRLALLVRQSSIHELFEARKVLEVDLAGLAAQRATEEDIALMQESLEEMRHYSGRRRDADRYVEADVAYHMAMANAAQNRVLYELFASVRELLFEVQAEAVKGEGITERSCGYHQMIIEAIKAQDVERARAVVLEHLNDVESVLCKIYVDLSALKAKQLLSQ